LIAWPNINRSPPVSGRPCWRRFLTRSLSQRCLATRDRHPPPATRARRRTPSTPPTRLAHAHSPRGDLLGLRRSPLCARRAEVGEETAVSRPLRVEVAGRAGRRTGSRSGTSDPTASAQTGRSRHSNRRRSRAGRHLRRPWPHESTAPPPPAPQAGAARHTSTVQQLTQCATSGHLPQCSARLPLWDEVRQPRSAVS
jgi:hypothetical protein